VEPAGSEKDGVEELPSDAVVTGSAAPLPDLVEEARRVLALANRRSLPLRVIGGLAIRLHLNEEHPSLEREFKDLDLVTTRPRQREVEKFFAEIGYSPDLSFNTLNSGRRGLFYDLRHERQLDLFVGSFRMCHEIPLADRLELEPETIPLAELLLTKLQIVHLNQKDLSDILALVLEHDVAETDGESINAGLVAKLCADDWGLWRTCKLTLERAQEGIGAFDFSASQRDLVSSRLTRLWERIELEPKSRRWRLRDRVGDRVRWYEEPEEVT
jgi:hypothetical protein